MILKYILSHLQSQFYDTRNHSGIWIVEICTPHKSFSMGLSMLWTLPSLSLFKAIFKLMESTRYTRLSILLLYHQSSNPIYRANSTIQEIIVVFGLLKSVPPTNHFLWACQCCGTYRHYPYLGLFSN